MEISYRDALNNFCKDFCLDIPEKVAIAQSAFYACHKDIMHQLATIPNPWKEAIINEGVCCEIGWDENDPRKSLQDIISWHVAVALDPRVSSSAQALIQYGAEMANKARVDPDRETDAMFANIHENRESFSGEKVKAAFNAAKPVCTRHDKTTASWDYVTCVECGAVLTDGEWGIASDKWFKNIEVARFYKQHGRYPE